jgi:hypothetical protein
MIFWFFDKMLLAKLISYISYATIWITIMLYAGISFQLLEIWLLLIQI